MDLTVRPRRLRGSETLRKIVRETRVDKSALIYPLFVMDGLNRVEEIPSMPGQYRYTVDRVEEELDRLTEAGVRSILLSASRSTRTRSVPPPGRRTGPCSAP